jgi:hypothetical protein
MTAALSASIEITLALGDMGDDDDDDMGEDE